MKIIRASLPTNYINLIKLGEKTVEGRVNKGKFNLIDCSLIN